jgi:hypothetical protein
MFRPPGARAFPTEPVHDEAICKCENGKAIESTDITDTHYLNVDLDIYAKCDLQPLVTALGKSVVVLYCGRMKRTHCAHLELARDTKTADSTIRRFCTLLEGLPRVQRGVWNAAKIRAFNIGVQAGMQPHSSELILTAETVERAAKLGAQIVFTVYAPDETEGSSEEIAG